MKMKIILSFLLVLPFVALQESNSTDFVATKEWQEILPGKIDKKIFHINRNHNKRKYVLRPKSSCRTSLSDESSDWL
jgi:hypothetical protein